MEDRLVRLERALRRTRAYGLGVSLLLAAISILALARTIQPRFRVLDVERINVVESDGTVRLAIANPDRLPPPTFRGKEYPGIRGGNAAGMAGMIYFNDEGTEMGGFGWAGEVGEDGAPRAMGLLTFDHFNQNEALSLSYGDSGGRRRAGLTVLDQPHVSIQPVADTLMAIMQLPDGPERTRRMRELREGMVERGEVGARRLYAGSTGDRAATVLLADPAGRPRLRLSVDSLGSATIEFLDADGKVTRRISEEGDRGPAETP